MRGLSRKSDVEGWEVAQSRTQVAQPAGNRAGLEALLSSHGYKGVSSNANVCIAHRPSDVVRPATRKSERRKPRLPAQPRMPRVTIREEATIQRSDEI